MLDILAGNVSIRSSINFTFYKNIPVTRTCLATPDDVLIIGFHNLLNIKPNSYLLHHGLVKRITIYTKGFCITLPCD